MIKLKASDLEVVEEDDSSYEEGMDVIEPETIDGRPTHKPLDPTKVSFESLGYTPLQPGEDPLQHDFRIDTKSRDEIAPKKPIKLKASSLKLAKEDAKPKKQTLADVTPLDDAAATAMGGGAAPEVSEIVQRGISDFGKGAAEVRKAQVTENPLQKAASGLVGAVDFIGKGVAGLGDLALKSGIVLSDLQRGQMPNFESLQEVSGFSNAYKTVLGDALKQISPSGVAQAEGVMGAISAPFTHVYEKYGAGAGFASEVGAALVPGAGIVSLKGSRRVKPRQGKSPMQEGLGDPNLSKDSPLANIPEEPVDINPMSRDWQDRSTELGGATPEPRNDPVWVMKQEAREARRIPVDEVVTVDPMADVKDYRSMASGERPPKKPKVELADLDAADSAWDDLTNDLRGRDDTPDLIDNDPYPDGDVVEAMDAVVQNDLTQASPDKTPNQVFNEALSNKEGGWGEFWKGVPSRITDWGKRAWTSLLREDSRRGAAARWKLMKDASDLEQTLTDEKNEGAPTKFRPETRGVLAADAAIDQLTRVKGLPSDVKTSLSMALGWLSRTLPRLMSSAENGIWFLRGSEMEAVAGAYKLHQKTGTLKDWHIRMRQLYPNVMDYIEHVSKRDHDGVPIITPENFVGKNAAGEAFLAWNARRNRRDPVTNELVAAKSAVIFNIDHISEYSNPIDAVGTLVHELIHARQWRVVEKKLDALTRHEYDTNVPYEDRTIEVKARTGEETARQKFAADMRSELKAIGLMPASASRYSYFPYGGKTDKMKVSSSDKANNPAKWSPGRIGPGRAADPAISERLDKILDYHVTKMIRDASLLADKIAGSIGKEAIPSLNDRVETSTKTFVENLGAVGDDIRFVPGFRTASYAASNSLIGKQGTRTKALLVAQHFLNKVKDAIRNEHSANYEMVKVFRDFEKHYLTHIPGIYTETRRGLFVNDVKTALWFEMNPDQWHTGANWYPSEQQLVGKGMTPESAKLWRSVFDQLEKTWDTLEDTAKNTGRRVPDRIPGYLPHTVHGSYRVIAYIPNKDGTPAKYFAELGARTMKEANELRSELQKVINDPKIMTSVQRPSPTRLGIDAMLDGIRATRDAFEASKGITALTKMIEDNAARSVLSHMLDRSQPTKFGHTLQRAAEDGSPFELDRRQMVDAIKTFTEYARAVNGYKERVNLVNKTLIPLDEAGLLDANPNLRHFVYDYFKNYIGIDATMVWDRVFKDTLANSGLSPTLYQQGLAKMQSTFAHLYLFANIPFYVVNSAQFTSAFPLLIQKAAEVRYEGGKKVNIMKAISEGSKRLPDLRSEKSLMKDPDMAWGQKNGYLDPQAIELLDPTTFHDPITQNIDRMTRRIAYSYGLEFWRQIKPLEEARVLAGEFANEVAVPYSHKAGSPVITGRLGPMGKSFTQFSTYPAHILSMLERQARLVKEGARKGDAVLTAEAATSMVSYAGLQVALFGMVALPLVQGLNMGIELINDLLGKNAIPTSDQVARSIDKAVGAPGLTEFGAISSGIGAVAGEAPYISGSASGVMPQLPTAFWRGITSMLDVAITGGMYLAGKKSPQDLYEATKSLPTFWGGVARNMLRDRGATTDQRGVHEAGQKRSEAMKLFSWAGVRSTAEQSARTTDRLAELTERRIANQIRLLNDKLAYSGSLDGYERELMRLMNDFQADPSTFMNALTRSQEDRTLSPDMRRAMAGIRARSPASYQRYLDLKQSETVRPPQP